MALPLSGGFGGFLPLLVIIQCYLTWYNCLVVGVTACAEKEAWYTWGNQRFQLNKMKKSCPTKITCRTLTPPKLILAIIMSLFSQHSSIVLVLILTALSRLMMMIADNCLVLPGNLSNLTTIVPPLLHI